MPAVDIAPATATPISVTDNHIATASPELATTTADGPKTENRPPAQEELVSISVLNGSGISGLAGKVADRLKAAGYTNVSTGNADKFDYTTTLIRHRADKEAVAGIISSSCRRRWKKCR